jgi:hypothetical protein
MKARLFMAILMSMVMALMVTLVATFINLGPMPNFVVYWMKAYALAWPVAGITAFVIMPHARSLADRIASWMDRPA